MTTDIELLEAAAKAYGLKGYRYCEPWNSMNRYTMQDGYFGPNWNPLIDDGDAFRLATKLGISIESDASIEVLTFTFMGYTESEYDQGVEAWHVTFDSIAQELYKGDRNAATRRAIVRVAAELSTLQEKTL